MVCDRCPSSTKKVEREGRGEREAGRCGGRGRCAGRGKEGDVGVRERGESCWEANETIQREESWMKTSTETSCTHTT